jgi:lipoprotein NlpI
MNHFSVALSLVLVLSIPLGWSADEKLDQLLADGSRALRTGKLDEALQLADEAVKAAPKDARVHVLRGSVRAAQRQPAKAIADFDQAIMLDAKLAIAYQYRGGESFKLGKIEDSLKDFDRFLELRPEEKPGHWQRGISLYYSGKFKEGAEQFQAGEKVFGDDVENAVWHFLCNARVVGPTKARLQLLKIGKDKRELMMVVYDLFAGKAKPEDVLAAVERGSPPEAELKSRRFYANLYLGLYYDAAGEKDKARQYLEQAAEDPHTGGYMGDVARVHLKLIRQK